MKRQTNSFILHKFEKSSEGPWLAKRIARSDILLPEKCDKRIFDKKMLNHSSSRYLRVDIFNYISINRNKNIKVIK